MTRVLDTNWPSHYPPIVYEMDGDSAVELTAENNGDDGVAVEELPLVVAPGTRVHHGGQTFVLNKETRYCFMHGCNMLRQAIVHQDDIPALFRGLAQLHIHGHKHNSLSVDEWLAIARRGHLSLTCDRISSFVIHIMSEFGYRTRRVSWLTLDEWNAYNNGHALFEYFCPKEKRWILGDVDMHMFYRDHRRRASAYDFHRCVVEGKPYELEVTTNIGTVDFINSYNDEQMECSLFMEQVYVNEAARHEAVQRLAQCLGLPQNEKDPFDFDYYFVTDDDEARARIESYSPRYHGMGTAEWLAKFYPA